jgi:MFS family permease
MKFHYIDTPLSGGIIRLVIHRVTIAFAIGLFGVFLPIYLFESVGQDVVILSAFYLITTLAYGLLLPTAMRTVINKIGMGRSIIVGTAMAGIFYAFVAALTPHNWPVIFIALGVTYTLFRLFYWVPYFTDFATFSDSAHRGSEVSLRESLMSLVSVFTPLIAGAIVTYTSFQVLFFIGVVIYFLATLPIFHIPAVHEQFTWTFRETWRNMWAHDNRSFVLWPLVIFLLLDGQYFEIGALSSVIIAVTMIIQLVTGRLTDRFSKEKMLHIGSALYAIGWVVKVFIATAFHIFIIDVYHRIARIFMTTPFEAMTYDITSGSGHYVDEYSVVREIAEQIGRSIVFVLIIILTLVFTVPLQWLFVIAALAAVALNTLHARVAKA